MSSLRQIEANRRNALKSTGPTSVMGKAVSSMNALKTGIHAKSLVLPSEKLADLEQLMEEYYHHHQPASPEARLLLDDLINCEWTLRRLHAAAGAGVPSGSAPAPTAGPPSLTNSSETTAPQIGFVPSILLPAPFQPPPAAPNPGPRSPASSSSLSPAGNPRSIA